MSELVDLAANVGFPMAVAAYLLIRIEGQLRQLTEAVQDLRQAVLAFPHTVSLSALQAREKQEVYPPA